MISFKKLHKEIELNLGDTVVIKTIPDENANTFKAIFNEWVSCKYQDKADSKSCKNCRGYMNITVCSDGRNYNECTGFTNHNYSSVVKIIKSCSFRPLKDEYFKI